MGDRAQYFLEQSLPELLDLQEKKIFSPLEIKSITRKRTSFEHALTRKIVRKADFLRYAEYEMNLEGLRVQRVKRLQIKGKKSVSDWAGPRRIFFIFERATKRFHGDVDLWLQYIDYAKRQKSNKVLGKAFTALLQYHPTDPAMWSLAAEHEMVWNGNMTAARSLMQRGLRLNTGSTALWLDYFKLELQYLEKIYGRRQVLGLDRTVVEEEESMIGGLGDDDADRIALPQVTQAEFSGDVAQDALLKDVEMSALTTATDNPALQGAIPLAIMKSALKAMPQTIELLLDFYDIMASFDKLPFRDSSLIEIVDLLSSDDIKMHPKASFLRVILPMSLLKDNVKDAKFPAALKESIRLYESAESSSHVELVGYWTKYLIALLDVPDVDNNLKLAVSVIINKAFKSCDKLTPALYGAWVKFERDQGRDKSSAAILERAQKQLGMEHFEA